MCIHFRVLGLSAWFRRISSGTCVWVFLYLVRRNRIFFAAVSLSSFVYLVISLRQSSLNSFIMPDSSIVFFSFLHAVVFSSCVLRSWLCASWSFHRIMIFTSDLVLCFGSVRQSLSLSPSTVVVPIPSFLRLLKRFLREITCLYSKDFYITCFIAS